MMRHKWEEDGVKLMHLDLKKVSYEDRSELKSCRYPAETLFNSSSSPSSDYDQQSRVGRTNGSVLIKGRYPGGGVKNMHYIWKISY